MTGETASTPSYQQLTSGYIETHLSCVQYGKNTKRKVYDLGSLQYVDAEPKEYPAAFLLEMLELMDD
ncbi:hypothetical protein F2Q68_00007995 [Brassica cretica]|uniref:Uncharacterized protein n=1 Tax=Brassica cretica TaxID=69181 RepID=A0A8S9Q3M3_BRACR|nr:hypothetical protein F2Q68_00007995 [Brassica cretica]KAF3535491.1 hypothetical protein F2Q69_00019473 [Brassica cretica]